MVNYPLYHLYHLSALHSASNALPLAFYQNISLGEITAELAIIQPFLHQWELDGDFGKDWAYYFATIKFHKNPPQLRFICGSGNTSFTSLGGVLTSIFRLVALEYRTVLWPAAFPDHPQCKSWFCLDSGAVMNNIHAFNHCQIPASTVIYPSAWDFTRISIDVHQYTPRQINS